MQIFSFRYGLAKDVRQILKQLPSTQAPVPPHCQGTFLTDECCFQIASPMKAVFRLPLHIITTTTIFLFIVLFIF